MQTFSCHLNTVVRLTLSSRHTKCNNMGQFKGATVLTKHSVKYGLGHSQTINSFNSNTVNNFNWEGTNNQSWVQTDSIDSRKSWRADVGLHTVEPVQAAAEAPRAPRAGAEAAQKGSERWALCSEATQGITNYVTGYISSFWWAAAPSFCWVPTSTFHLCFRWINIQHLPLENCQPQHSTVNFPSGFSI